MRKTISNIMPVGAPWGGPEGFKFLSCFTSLTMYLEKTDCTSPLYCDRDVRLCNRCGECGVTVWENKYHEQIYHGFLTLSGVSCYTVWPRDAANTWFSDNPLAFTDVEFIKRTMDFTGYTYHLLQNTSEDEMRNAIIQSIDSNIPVLAYNLVNNDWCLVSGYDSDGDTLFGRYVSESWDDPQRKPEFIEDGIFSKTKWFNHEVRLCLVTGKKAPRNDYSALFHYLKATLQQPDNVHSFSGLSAFEECKSTLLNDDRFISANQDELTQTYKSVHIFIGVLAESRCFAAFAFWAGIFGRITDEAALVPMRKIGDIFMDTHNQCWGAWAAMGQDYQCQPELYLDKFVEGKTRKKLVEYVDLFKANDEKAIRVLDEICTIYPSW